MLPYIQNVSSFFYIQIIAEANDHNKKKKYNAHKKLRFLKPLVPKMHIVCVKEYSFIITIGDLYITK